MWRLVESRVSDSGVATRPRATDEDGQPHLACLGGCDQGDAGDDGDHGIDKEERARLDDMQNRYWRQVEAGPVWEVPMGRDLDIMPWLPRRSAGVLEAINRARALHMTALLVDNSPDKVVDTFFLYRPVQVLEAKAMVVEERTGKRSRAQILEQARVKLVNAMRYGQQMYVRMGNTACAFKIHYSSPTTLPLAIFDQRAVDELNERYSGAAADNLYHSDHPFAGALREADTEHGVFTCRRGFEVVVSTHLAKGDFAALLERALPMSLLQPIVPCVKPRPSASAGQSPHGGLLGLQLVPPPADNSNSEAPWTLQDAHRAAVRLRQRVEAARAARAGGGDAAMLGSCGGSHGGGSCQTTTVAQAHSHAPDAPTRLGPALDMHGLDRELQQSQCDALCLSMPNGSGQNHPERLHEVGASSHRSHNPHRHTVTATAELSPGGTAREVLVDLMATIQHQRDSKSE